MKHIFNIFFVHIHNLKSLIDNIISINNNCLAFSLFETYFQNIETRIIIKMRYPTPRRSISRNYHIKGSNKLLYFALLVQRKANLEFSANNFPVKYARIH